MKSSKLLLSIIHQFLNGVSYLEILILGKSSKLCSSNQFQYF